MSAVLLGADLGTSGLKLVALGEDGRIAAETEAGYPVDGPHEGWAECAVGTWRAALDDALARLLPALGGRPVAGLGLSGQMHGTVLVDEAGAALAPAVLWPDRRAVAEVARWRALPDAARAALANPLVPGMTGPVLAWLTAHRPDLVARAAGVLLPKDALRATLLPGADWRVTDRSDASGTLLWDVVADTWSDAARAVAGVPPGLLPAVRSSAAVAGTAVLGEAGVPVVVGGADTPLALLAAGATGGLQVNLGTGAQVLRPGWTPAPADDPPVHGYADAEGGWYAMAALQNGGSAWAWAAGVLGVAPGDLFDLAASSPPGAGGAVFRPFLTGERGGVAGPGDRASWTGLSAGTTRSDLARAAVEGVLTAVADAARLLGEPPDGPVVLTGGGGRSPLVRQVLADLLGRPVVPLALRSASAVGAAVLAGRGVGLAVEPERAAGEPVSPRE
ncbi:FGGY family carbohydrate kinase [Geodermatophilus nigrescens]